ncbi:hypothetical protein KC345_g11038 [Hortaea werneckii]|nr:hypothetical protein KC345_g11038 [Hortaea werneckii]
MEHPFSRTIGYWSKRIYRDFNSLYDQKLAVYGLTSAQVNVLEQLWTYGDGLTQKELHEKLGIQPSSLTNLLNALVEGDWVVRKSDALDARVKRIFLTEKGTAQSRICMEMVMELEAVVQQGMSPEEIALMLSGLVLIDTGVKGSGTKIIQAIQSMGYTAGDITTILLTHCHPDHAGAAAELKQMLPQVRIYASEQDAPIVERGLKQRAMTAAPGLMNKLLFQLFVTDAPVDPVHIDGTIKDNEVLDYAGEMKVISIPGHSLGQLAFLHPAHGGVLFAADAAGHVTGLGWSIGYEDLKVGEQSLIKLGREKYSIACFGHGKPIEQGAAAKFRSKWPGKG